MLRWLDPPTTAYMIQRKLGANLPGPACQNISYRWQNWQNISPELALAVIAAEDQRFAEHIGFDFTAIQQAIKDGIAAKRLRGGSTISQQLTKNLFLWPERSLLRKGLEVYFTALIELTWPKQRILEVYLNTIQFDSCTFGVEAASHAFFNQSASQINRSQAALMAAVLPAPHRLKVTRPTQHLRRKQSWIVRQIKQLGGKHYLTQIANN
ncbi:monofunctional biosynthetic peptidoglycan transglycosylase [Spartinivicinus poritis]|uniref:Monofunctional biosynthetic peptidoglycan transglycosylase n=1 Tax=Spartinivicinus poritis TaxID=2994640 RepID=A0ABT5U7B0_9GAMM|nr:monofunctional biosynthetic peptidoglycan transglycosylase [Spartinivicinus sp. A2-2]MDE1461881.1 monofunctional biosynthetic peptidoglycan transglycosylase [Spartinivicinus sp. A2-2]